MRYLIALSRWLRKNRPDIDVVCVSRLSHEAHTAVGALAGSGIPVVVRAEADESFDLTHSAKTGRSRQPDAAPLPCRPRLSWPRRTRAEQRLAELGIDRHRIHPHQQRHEIVARRARPALKTAARRALAEVNEDLRVPANQPVALVPGPVASRQWLGAWSSGPGSRWPEQWPYARLWLVGDGLQREALYRRIRDADLVGPRADAR